MEAWLRSIRLEHYGAKFCAGGFITLEDCARITEPDLISMDILPGHRKRILMNLPVPPPPRQQQQQQRPGEDDSDYQNVLGPSRRDSQQSNSSDAYVPPSFNTYIPASSSVPNTPRSEAIYGNVFSPTSEEANAVYDVPSSQPVEVFDNSRGTDGDSEDDEYYVNVSSLKKPSRKSPTPPVLPPKKNSIQMDSIDDALGHNLSGEHVAKKPVPAPRRGVRSGGSSSLADIPTETAQDGGGAADESPKSAKRPTPKPRMKRNASGSSMTTSTTMEALQEGPNEADVFDAIGALDDMLDNEVRPSARRSKLDDVRTEGKVLSPDEGIASGIEEDDTYEPYEVPCVPSTAGIHSSTSIASASPPPSCHPKPPSLLPHTPQPALRQSPVSPEKPKPSVAGPEGPSVEKGIATSHTQASTIMSDPGYQAVWVMSSSSSSLSTSCQTTANTDRNDLRPKPPDADTVCPIRPGLTPLNLTLQPGQATCPLSPDSTLWSQFSPGSRESILSFNDPPPNFTPPPLPRPLHPTSQDTAPRPTQGPPMLRPLISPSTPLSPPVVPPRPKLNAGPRSASPSPEATAPSPVNRTGTPTATSPTVAATAASPPVYDTPAKVKDSMVEADDLPDTGYSSVETRENAGVSPEYDEVAKSDAMAPVSEPERPPSQQETSPSCGACALPPEPVKIPTPVAPSRRAPQSPKEENIYVDEPFMKTKTPPPVPPPRGHRSVKSLCDGATNAYNPSLDQGAKNFAELESDDTLSDGGEFLESDLRHLRPSVLQTSIPIVPATPNSIKERKGYLYKLPSRRSQKRLGWRKRWVTFDGEELMYFSDEKSIISKRIIPLNTIVNVEQQIKMHETHPYEFCLTTIDRVYRFAADDKDDLALWTSILMRAIIDSKGFVRMEGLKGRQYLVIKKAKFCYYNTFSDYKVGTPIHRVDLKLASVKDGGKHKLLLLTPTVSFGLMCEGEAEMLTWKEAFEEGIAEGLGDDTILKEVFENHSNRLCADCGAPDPHWASINLGITLCKQCAGVHRMLSVPLSKIRSLRMDFRVWTPTLIQMIQKVGNDNSNNFWEWNSTEDDRIDSDADMSSRQEYVLAKYRDRRFCRLHPLHSDVQSLNEALCKSVQYGDVLETLQLLFSGADILCTSNMYGGQMESPLQLARKAKQTLQTEFLFQNGAEGSGQWPVNQPIMGEQEGVTPQLQSVTMKGYLHKLQSNQREYQRRWFVLERGVVSYFENDKSTVARDTIERKEIMSICATSDDKQRYGFELGTTKASGRLYTIAADTQEEQHQWMVKIAKSFAPLPTESLEKIRDLDRGGLVFLREGATTDWQMTWMHLKKKTLHIFKKDEQEFEEVDLRKVTGVSKFKQLSTQTLQRTDLCIDTFDDGPPFVIDLPNRALYIQGDTRRETESWYELLQKVSTEPSGYLVDYQLTAENVPVIVDKCINFISAHGIRLEGLYRLNGQHSKVGQLLEEFKSNAHSVFLSLELYQVHDVATALKRFFRTLNEPLLTTALFTKWIETSNMTESGPKMQWYKYLLGELPPVHYATLKRLMVHIASVSSFEILNKMSDVNLASIFGPILMRVDKDTNVQEAGYGSTNQEITVLLDLLSNHKWLFEVKDDELEHERKILEALEKIERASRATQSQAGDLLVGIYINDRNGQVVTLKVPASMTAQEVLKYVETKAELDSSVHWGIFEVICHGQLERPLHFRERVLDVNLRWSGWSEEFSKDNFLVVKPNVVLDRVNLVFDPHFSLFNEFKYSDKKGYKKYYFEFSKYKLSFQKDTRATNPICSWNIEDLVLYIGVEQKRQPATKWSITFIPASEKIVKSKDAPFFGHSISCASEEEMYRWLAAMLHAQNPSGLVPEGVSLNSTSSNDPPLPVAVEPAASASPTDSPRQKKGSFLKKFMNNRR